MSTMKTAPAWVRWAGRLPAALRVACLVAAAAAVAATGPTAHAQGLPVPAGDIVLTVSGDITVRNDGDTAVFDLDLLRQLPVTQFRTTTIWTEGEHTFTGVQLADLLSAVGADGTTIRAAALNEYTVEIPVSDAVPDGPIVAYAMDGRTMSPRDKGPLWIVYPYDSHSEYQSETAYSRSIWQLSRLEIVD